MIRAGLTVLAIAASIAAAPAFAQAPAPPSTPADPIDALLKRAPPKDVDPEEPDTAAAGSRVDPDPVAPRAPPRRSTLTTPVQIEETGKAPDGPPSVADMAYDTRLKSSAASAQ